MKFIRVLISLLVAALVVGNCHAFDGNRKGFIIGGGIGIGPKAYSTTSSGWSGMDESGWGTSLMIGHAWNENTAVVLLHDATVFNHTFISGGSFGAAPVYDERTVSQGLLGMALFRYYGSPGRAFYLAFGIGLQYRMPLDNAFDTFENGPGLLLGTGYEFIPHVQFYGSLSGGATTRVSTRYYHYQVLLAITAVAF